MGTRAWTTLNPLDGSVGAWVAQRIGRFGTVGGQLPGGYPAYAVVHQAPHDDHDVETEGDLDLETTYAVLRDVVGRHTTSSDYVVGQWEGFGYFGGGWRTTGVMAHPDGVVPDGLAPGWERVPSSFGDAATTARRLRLPERDHVLFAGVLDDLRPLPVAPDDAGHDGFLPSIVWPEDRAWVAATDVDDWVTLVAASAEAVTALVADDRLRVERVGWETPCRLTWIPADERDGLE